MALGAVLGMILMKDLLETSLCVSILLAQLWQSIWLATLCLNFITRLFLKGLNIVIASKRPFLLPALFHANSHALPIQL